jgi:NAD(P)-dependent dehydrogenase (short-subunit alcohol dehydrogenase family)
MTDVAEASVFITGAAAGIGLGIARAFARAGARLALTDIDAVGLAAAQRELSENTDIVTFELDVRDREAFARVADCAEDQLGPIDVLCNNAGVGTVVPPPLTALSYQLWDFVLDVNLGGTINGLQTFLPRMLARTRPGHIVNVASSAGLVASDKPLYVASKFAVVGLSESLSQQRELAEHDIQVTVVCPGFVRTQIMTNTSQRQPGCVTDELEAAIEARRPLFETFGLSPDVVGEQVVRGVREGKLYVHTDRMMAGMVMDRAKAIVEAMPEETERDQQIAAVLDQQILAVMKS